MKAFKRKLLTVFVGAAVTAHGQQSSGSPTGTIDAAYTRATQDYQDGHLSEAQGELATFASAYPSDSRTPSALFTQGMCEFKLGHQGDAVLTWDWLAQRYSQSSRAADAMEQIAQYDDSRADHASAEELRQKIITQYPTHPLMISIWTNRGDTAFKAGRYAEAINAYQKVESNLAPEAKQNLETAEIACLTKSNPEAHFAAADEKLDEGNSEAAGKLYLAYLESNPTGIRSSEAKTKLGWCEYTKPDQPDLDRAEQLWREVIGSG